VELEHSAAVTSELELLRELEQGLTPRDVSIGVEDGFTIFASRPLTLGAVEYRFGSRTACATRISLGDVQDSGT
jgi:hypothetical protein